MQSSGTTPDKEPDELQKPNNGVAEATSPTLNNSTDTPNHEQSSQQSDQGNGSDLRPYVEVTPRVEEAVEAAWSGVAVEAAGVFLSFVSIVLVVYAILQTQKSLRLAQKDRVTATRRSVAQAGETAEALRYGAQSADAMTSVAQTMESNATHIKESVEASKRVADQQLKFGRMQMRPVLSVLIGRAIYQDAKNNFSVAPILRNTGNTAARNVKFRIAAGILPSLLPQHFKFWLPEVSGGSNTIGPGQTGDMFALIEGRVSQGLVPKIKVADGDALYVWGCVSYQDAFRTTFRTTFAQQIFWRQTGIAEEDGYVPEVIEGIYLGRHNRAN